MIIPLRDAVANTSGGKAGTLGALLRAGLPVPDGFVIPFDAYPAAARGLDVGADRLSVGSDRLSGEADRPGVGADRLGIGADRPGVGADMLDAARREIAMRPLPAGLLDSLARALGGLGDVPVAVRSSANSEDTVHASGAGQHESVLAVRGVADVASAVRTCWGSLHSSRAIAYRNDPGTDQLRDDPVMMAVLVQRLVDAEVSGVMFTSAGPEGTSEIEASWGLGPSVVEGMVTPDAYRVAADGSITRTISDKRTRLDRDGHGHGDRDPDGDGDSGSSGSGSGDGSRGSSSAQFASGLVTRDVPAVDRDRPTLDAATVARLVSLGQEAAALLGGSQDIEWAIAGERIWLLQARPITATPPPAPADAPVASPTLLAGTPASQGIATGTARIVRGPADFPRVRPGDILVCPYTDPAWTPLLRIAAGVVTDTGGVLSHAAIVARELRIPAVVGLPDATATIHDSALITIDGTTGTVTTPDT
ncbi:PEP-utilizing enzyme [Kribbella sp. NBC_01245]|uniref:PEP/pyruvate-binding domain-containing protein n=1 Tax=Kribbella sp. NBC_01245 TaxID=2903578 RepID=UPI002E282B45|nr:PEP/pyruvate-binding domain-containing protein [Kribbella sp. NBC_01245]